MLLLFRSGQPDLIKKKRTRKRRVNRMPELHSRDLQAPGEKKIQLAVILPQSLDTLKCPVLMCFQDLFPSFISRNSTCLVLHISDPESTRTKKTMLFKRTHGGNIKENMYKKCYRPFFQFKNIEFDFLFVFLNTKQSLLMQIFPQ